MKYILLSDIHFGNHGNSNEFNQQCLQFLDFVEKKTENMDIDGAIFLGDWFHSRNTINVLTLQMGVEGLYKLGNIGRGNAYFILGNHDLYYKDRRDIHSIVIPEGDIGVQLITEPIMIDNLLMCPWLIENESLKKIISKYSPEYVFCHPELPSFPINSVSKFEGEYNPSDYIGPKRICCGHFHKKSEKNNITYIGNCFSHNFSDANDWHNKGFSILDTETNELTQYEWENAPKYCTAKISQMNNIEFGSNMYLKLYDDVNMKPLDLMKLKEEIEKLPQIKECYLCPMQLNIEENQKEEANLETISDIGTLVTSLLSNMDMANIDNQKIINIYNEL